MPFLELLVPLRSFVALKARKLIAWLWRGIKYFLRHPIKSIFVLVKLWFCLMLVTVFATMAIASQPDMTDLRDPEIVNDIAGECASTLGFNLGYSKTLDECITKFRPAFLSSINNDCGTTIDRISPRSEFSVSIYFTKRQMRTATTNPYCASTSGNAVVGLDRIKEREYEQCPPKAFPDYFIPVQTSNGLKCAKLFVENKCPEPQSTDGYVFGTATSPANICYDNPEDDSQCVINTDDSGGYYLPSKYNSQEPTDCKAKPKDDGDDKFCTATGTSGVYSVVCPESSISFDITGIQKNADQLVVNHQRISEIEASFLTQQDIDSLVQSGELKGEKGDQGEKGDKGEKGEKGDQGIAGIDGQDGKDGIDGINGIDGRNGLDGLDGEDGENCTVINTPTGATISCPDGSQAEVAGVDEDAIVSELTKQTTELKKQTDAITKLGTYDGDAPTIDYSTKPEKYTEIATFDWETTNFGTVLEEHNEAMRTLPLFSAIDDFFVTSFGGSCPVWQETVTVLDASFTVTIDQFCSSAVQSILPYIRAILMLVAGFFAWRIAIE